MSNTVTLAEKGQLKINLREQTTRGAAASNPRAFGSAHIGHADASSSVKATSSLLSGGFGQSQIAGTGPASTGNGPPQAPRLTLNLRGK